MSTHYTCSLTHCYIQNPHSYSGSKENSYTPLQLQLVTIPHSYYKKKTHTAVLDLTVKYMTEYKVSVLQCLELKLV